MAITAETRTEIIELVVAATNSAPGTALLTQLVADSDGGASLADIAATLHGISATDEIAMIAMDIEMQRDRARANCIELQCLPEIEFKETPIVSQHGGNGKKGKNRNRWWEGS